MNYDLSANMSSMTLNNEEVSFHNCHSLIFSFNVVCLSQINKQYDYTVSCDEEQEHLTINNDKNTQQTPQYDLKQYSQDEKQARQLIGLAYAGKIHSSTLYLNGKNDKKNLTSFKTALLKSATQLFDLIKKFEFEPTNIMWWNAARSCLKDILKNRLIDTITLAVYDDKNDEYDALKNIKAENKLVTALIQQAFEHLFI